MNIKIYDSPDEEILLYDLEYYYLDSEVLQ